MKRIVLTIFTLFSLCSIGICGFHKERLNSTEYLHHYSTGTNYNLPTSSATFWRVTASSFVMTALTIQRNVTSNYGLIFARNYDSSLGIGIRGDGSNYGILGNAEAGAGNYGVYGKCGAGLTGNGIGLRGTGDAYGVYANANGNSGASGTGVYGEGYDYGIYGLGTTVGVYGSGTTAGYFLGNGYFSGNVGLGTANPVYKLEVKGNGYYRDSVKVGSMTAYGTITSTPGAVLGAIDISSANSVNIFSVNSTGTLRFMGKTFLSYGGIYLYNGSSQITTSADWEPLTSTIAYPSVYEFIIIDTTTADTPSFTVRESGVYEVFASVSFSGSGSKTYEIGVSVNNGTPDVKSIIRRKLGATGDVGNCGVCERINLNAFDKITLKVKSTDGGTAFTPEALNFIIKVLH